ncbi:hypothetical protein [Streptomyces cucumeris]|uniref:hypothetical protein n=1 Tax=Streptomyces cucumeris TaxID=2962890 RepID=UPI003D70771E
MKIAKHATLTAAITAAAIFCTGMSGIAMASGHVSTNDTAAVETAAPDEAQQLIDALSVIDAMPQSVVDQGDAAVEAYLKEHLPSKVEVQAFGWWGTLKCVASITAAVAGGAVPVVKVLKLKAFIRKVGSVKKAAHLLIRIAKGEEKLDHLSSTLAGLATSILGVDSIKRNCR